MDKIKKVMDFLKTTGTTIGMILTLVIWIGKPYADEYIDKRVEEKVKDLKTSQAELIKGQKATNETIDKLVNMVLITMDDKDKKKLEQLQNEKKTLLGK